MAVDLFVKLTPKLESLGTHLAIEGKLEVPLLASGGREFTLSDGIGYQLELTNTGGAVLLSGTAYAQLDGSCDRCLSSATIQVSATLQEYLVFKGSHADSMEANSEFVVVDPTGEINLAPFLESALIFELPMIILCKPNCAGLCAHCGINLNDGDCTCIDEPMDDHPFAALKDLL